MSRHGQVGTMIATMAHSPAVLAGYLDLSRATKRAKLDRKLSERVSIAVQARLGCRTCLDSHMEAAKGVGGSDDEIEVARTADSEDPRGAALLRFATKVLTEPASLDDDDDLMGLLHHGYSEQEVVDVVGIVALNQLTGSFNLVAGL
ncbi:MAG: carboxymuconolactone decarboxylase family protein [Actinomycetota bacterium]|nr:carboxymuconolactone decarboxylase family protein [Actinomycetota bacterium]